jgi:hypothetical protein
LSEVNPKPFRPSCRNGVYRLIEDVQSRLPTYDLSKNLWLTRTVCWCILMAVFEIVKAGYATLEHRGHVGVHILCRSLVEYSLDLWLLALRNDTESNRRFANYHKLLLYWMRMEIENYPEEIPRIEQEYRDYVQAEFAQMSTKKKGGDKQKSLLLWCNVEENVKKHFRKHWSGLDFPSRLREVESKLADFKLNLKHPQGFSSDSVIPNLKKFYYHNSNFTHTTVYGAVPHFNPKTETFEFRFNFTDRTLADDEHSLVFATLDSILGFSVSLTEDERIRLISDLDNTILTDPQLKKLCEGMIARATHSRH